MAAHRVTWSENYTQEIEIPDELSEPQRMQWLEDHLDSDKAAAEGMEIILVEAL